MPGFDFFFDNPFRQQHLWLFKKIIRHLCTLQKILKVNDVFAQNVALSLFMSSFDFLKSVWLVRHQTSWLFYCYANFLAQHVLRVLL